MSMYIGMRFTHSKFPDLKENPKKAMALVRAFWSQKKYKMVKYIQCIEKLDSFGQPCKGGDHIHIHMLCDPEHPHKKDSVQRDWRNWCKTREIVIKGKEHYALCYDVSPEDEDRWFRYPLKEQGATIKCSENMVEFVKQMMPIAIDERKRQIEDNVKAQERFLDKSSFKGKMYEEFDKQGIDQERIFAIKYIKYCREKQKIPSFSKIEDYWIDYQMATGRMTAEFWVLNYYKNKKINIYD